MKKVICVGIFRIVLFILLSVTLYDYLNTGIITNYSFSSLLNIFANAPKVDTSWAMIDLTIYADWGDFDFFRGFINMFSAVIEYSLFIVSALWQGLHYIVYFLTSLFRFGVSVTPGAGGGGGGSW